MKQPFAVAVLLILFQPEVLSLCGSAWHCDSCNLSYKCDKCHSGYILDSSTWCQQCPSTCSGCDGDSDCAACKPGYYGFHCSSSCEGCNDDICDKASGACSDGCEVGFYQDSDGKCPSCSGNCTKCSTYTNCSECLAGLYGSQCRASCPGCVDGLCDIHSGACTLGCKGGYYNDNSTGHCLECKTNCATCTAYNTCTRCTKGFYWITNLTCTECPGHCKNGTICNHYNGSCEEGCEDMWSGEQCFDQCAPGCKQCSQFNISSCGICHNGRYGESCEKNCSSGCKSNNQSQICDNTSGVCELGCIDGAWRETCENSCGSGCTGGHCNISNGYCLNFCMFNYFGDMCDELCSENCIATAHNSSLRSCHEENGHCLYDCRPGWFGEKCSEECSKHCKDVECYRNNGSCFYGCIDGYSGLGCRQAQRTADKGSDLLVIGGGAGAAAVVLAVLTVVIFVVILRRRKISSDTRTGDRDLNLQYSTTLKPGLSDSNMNEIKKPERVTTAFYDNESMLDVSSNKEAVEISNMHSCSEVCLKEETEKNERCVIEAYENAAKGNVDNTYCNLCDKRVAVEKLAEYLNQKTPEELLSDFDKLPQGLLNCYQEAQMVNNIAKNKYKAIYPYDKNRVILLDGGSDYMNASYIDGYNRSKEYIASSGPFQRSYDTTPDFWRMIWQEKCETLVMLTKPVEEGQTKCVKYWPEAGECCAFGDIHITCLTEDPYADFTIRILAVTKGGESFNIRHAHFTAWPDKDIPHDVTSMIEFRQKVMSLHKDKDSPMIAHCSAGIGRTGTFIVLDMLTYEGEDRGSVDIFGSVAGLRYQRCNMVQTPEQYVYLHHAVLHSLTFDCRSIPGDMFLQNYNKLIERNGGERIIDKQFQQLQSIIEEMTDEDIAQIKRNKTLPNQNREYADVPADENRVRLHENRKPGTSDYINAVYINSFRKRRQFIVAQTPLPSTVDDFLSLIHQENCACFVSMDEPDIQDKTVKVYWPADNQVVKHGEFKVSCRDSTTTNHFVTKKLSIAYHGPNGEESRDVNLVIVTNWPKDSPVPNTSDSLLELVKTVDDMNRKSETEPPILIHCRTGADRSCLYCAVSVLVEKMETEHEVSVVNTLRQIKARRFSAISSVEQYKFCHQAVISYLQSFDIYSNFGLKEFEAKSISDYC